MMKNAIWMYSDAELDFAEYLLIKDGNYYESVLLVKDEGRVIDL